MTDMSTGCPTLGCCWTGQATAMPVVASREHVPTVAWRMERLSSLGWIRTTGMEQRQPLVVLPATVIRCLRSVLAHARITQLPQHHCRDLTSRRPICPLRRPVVTVSIAHCRLMLRRYGRRAGEHSHTPLTACDVIPARYDLLCGRPGGPHYGSCPSVSYALFF